MFSKKSFLVICIGLLLLVNYFWSSSSGNESRSTNFFANVYADGSSSSSSGEDDSSPWVDDEEVSSGDCLGCEKQNNPECLDNLRMKTVKCHYLSYKSETVYNPTTGNYEVKMIVERKRGTKSSCLSVQGCRCDKGMEKACM